MMQETLTIYLDPIALAQARAGKHNFFGRVKAAVEGRGWQVDYLESTLANRLEASARPGYALYHMEEPTHERALTCRRRYVGAFWSIERGAARWDWPIVDEVFDPSKVHPDKARDFADIWRKRIWPQGVSIRDAGHIFMPLQGRLLVRRDFQSLSPVDMIRKTLMLSGRSIIATLHPHERYTADERDALDALVAENPRLTVQNGDSLHAMASCSRIVTENSALAFEGYFLHKPVALFARIDFHHIATSIPRDGMPAAFLPQPAPDYDRYLYWFLQQRSINAGRDDTGAQILNTLRGHGWPI